MYTCPKCGQEMIDKKDFCVKCGFKLHEEKGISIKLIIFIAGILVLVGIIVCFMIANYNSEDDIKEYLPNNSDKSIEDRLNDADENENKEVIIFPED